MSKRLLFLIIPLALAASGWPSGAAEGNVQEDDLLQNLYRVAQDDCGVQGQQPHLFYGSNYRYTEKDIPPDRIPMEDPARTVAFGSRVSLRYQGLRRDAEYKVRLTCLSDSEDRSMCVEAGGVTLLTRLTLPKAGKVYCVLALPREVYGDGNLELKLIRLTGANAVISAIELWSTERELFFLDISATGDLKGHLRGVVRDAHGRPAVQARIEIRVHNSEERVETASDDSGCFLAAIPGKWRNLLDEFLSIEAVRGESKGMETVPMLEVFLPRLTPRPVSVGNLSELQVDLNGTWLFHPAPPDAFWKADVQAEDGWSPIQVPGEWAMQDFVVEEERAAGYQRDFRLPEKWKGKRIKLRCDGVYSDAKVWINGLKAGSHTGGFTPFELDVTGLVRPGLENTISLLVRNESIADTLASGTRYAAHPLGGITRSISLFAVPALNLSSIHVDTRFDEKVQDAILRVMLEISNEGHQEFRDAAIRIGLKDPDRGRVEILPHTFALPRIEENGSMNHEIQIPVPSPKKWDAEHPRLYELTCWFEAGGRELEAAKVPFGFRQAEVRGNRLFINNRPVKLRGVCRHEVHPLRGRSLTPELWKKDAEQFCNANVNYIRTSHYPPAEEFLHACDALGIFVEEEAPICWAGWDWGNPKWEGEDCHDRKFLPEFLRPTLEMIQRDRSHPCVVLWSLANESRWGPNFEASARCVRLADPSRPMKFTHGMRYGDVEREYCEVGALHYPGPAGPANVAENFRPVAFDEYCHLNTYNREEIAADPGLRDYWGRGFAAMWEAMLASPGCLGGALWAGIDDVFILAGGRRTGYGDWGLIDGWRRAKPEYWHVKKTYSPVRILTRSVANPKAGEPIVLQVSNRHDFTNLNEVRFVWALAGETGIATADIAPRCTGTLSIQPKSTSLGGETLSLQVYSPRGFLVDSYEFPVGMRENPVSKPGPGPGGSLELTEKEGLITVKGDRFEWIFNGEDGRIQKAEVQGREVLTGGPHLMILPLRGGKCMPDYSGDSPPFTETCREWKASEVSARETAGGVEILVKGAYREASCTYTMQVRPGGWFTVKYRLLCSEETDPRQIGIVFDLPKRMDTLTWKRKAQWSVYPEDHPGRPVGKAKAFPDSLGKEGVLKREPTWAWSLDGNALGTRDFRSSKWNILQASLQGEDGAGVTVWSNGSQTVRTFVDTGFIRCLVAQYSNGGAESFFSSHDQGNRKPLKKGDELEDTVNLELIPPSR